MHQYVNPYDMSVGGEYQVRAGFDCHIVKCYITRAGTLTNPQGNTNLFPDVKRILKYQGREKMHGDVFFWFSLTGFKKAPQGMLLGFREADYRTHWSIRHV